MEKLQFAERIRKFRISRGLSQKELGERLGVSNRAVSKWERGEAYPTVDTLGEIAMALGCKRSKGLIESNMSVNTASA